MQRGAIPIGLVGGFVSALLLLSAGRGSVGGSIVLFFLGPLPLFIVGLGWGAVAVTIAAVCGALVAGALIQPLSGGIYMLTQGLPAIVLSYLAQLNRGAIVSAGPAPAPSSGVEWYPIGRVVAAAALVAGALAAFTFAISVAFSGNGELEDLRKAMKEFIQKTFLGQLPGFDARKLSPADLDAAASTFVGKLPSAMSILWLVTLVLNLWLGGRVTLASGRLARPWPQLATLQLPAGLALALAVTLALSMLPGMPGLLARALSTACLAAYGLQGLAILHLLSAGKSWRGFLLFGAYAGLLVTGEWGAYTLALIGLAEPISPLNRSRVANPPGADRGS